MDILTQGLLGGVLAQSVAQKSDKKIASFVGFFAGLLADADFLISSSNDPLLNIEYHRHFTHSLLFVPVGAALALIIMWPFFRKRVSIRHLYLFCLAGYSMSGVLDACTSYGTHLFWPFSDARIAFNIISIVDPVFTFMLLAAFLIGIRNQSNRVAYIGLILCVTYLSLGFVQQKRAQTMAEQLVQQRGHSTAFHIVKPTLANLLLWRSVYSHDDRIYVDAVRLGIFDANKIYEGDSVKKLIIHKDMQKLNISSVLYLDIQRFIKFSGGFVAFDPEQDFVLGDLRYSMLPTSIKPLWGIVIDIENPQIHADYRFFRNNSQDVRQSFLNMLLGR